MTKPTRDSVSKSRDTRGEVDALPGPFPEAKAKPSQPSLFSPGEPRSEATPPEPEEWCSPASGSESASVEGARDPMQAASEAWRREHAESVSALTEEMLEPGASGAERALAKAAAHDLLLSEQLGQVELEVAMRLATLTTAGETKHLPMLHQVLMGTMRARTEGIRRGSELLKTTASLATRRIQLGQRAKLRLAV